jgi:hypothetical protein
MAKTERPPTFGELIDEIQKSPDPFGPPPATDLANPFAAPLPKGERFVNSAKTPFKPMPNVDYEHHSEMFNLCNQTERAEYNDLQAQIANTEDHFLVTKERHWTKDGDCLCLVEWITTKASKKKAVGRSEEGSDDGFDA